MFNGIPLLEELFLGDNLINTIQNDTFSQLPNLVKIDLYLNNITSYGLTSFWGLKY